MTLTGVGNGLKGHMRSFKKEKLLIIEGHPFIANLLKEILLKSGYSYVDICPGTEASLASINLTPYSLILLDQALTEFIGFELLQRLHGAVQIPIMMLVDSGQVDDAVSALRLGAADILEKPLHAEKVMSKVERVLTLFGLSRTFLPAEEEGFCGLIGTSFVMKKIFNLIERIRESSVNVLITGPSGSGKEMIAAALHHMSPRAHRKFVAINCSAIPDTLLEGELFGYKKGAFTDARTDKVGLFQEADGGTLFLDEIGDMPLSLQPKILRAIQEKEIRPLGGLEITKVDVRIIAATNQNLQEKMIAKLFREDLYYRLNAMQIELPPLSERAEDIPLLAQYFVTHMAQAEGTKPKRISSEALAKLMAYSWPGNIRELENAIERANLLAKGDTIEVSDLLFPPPERMGSSGSPVIKKSSLADIEREYIMQVLNASGGNRSQTALTLRIGRKTLYNKLARYGI